MARRNYDNPYPSVTQVLGGLRKMGLEIWFKTNTPEFIKEESDKGKKIGSLIHEAIQSHIEQAKVEVKTEYPEEVANVLKSFMLFRKEWPKIKLKKAEIKLTSEKHKFNGTLDCLGNDGRLAVGDWKSGKCKVDTPKEVEKPPIYDEHIDQVSAYAHLYNEQMKTDIWRAFVVAFAKDKVAYNILFLGKEEIQESFKNVFLPALKIYNYGKRR